jgi:hypothetical protein
MSRRPINISALSKATVDSGVPRTSDAHIVKSSNTSVILSGALCREGPMQLAGSAEILRAKYALRMTLRFKQLSS